MTIKHQLLVIGGGAAGLATAFGAGYLGVDVGLVERHRLGGECTWWGCIPSKTLIDVARRVHESARGDDLGIASCAPSVDFRAVMRHIRSVSEEVAQAEDQRALASAGVDLHRGNAHFIGSHRVQLAEDTTIEADQIVIATGADPVVPSGLDPGGPITSKTVWELDVLPHSLVVVGGGSVGCEFAQAMARLGSQVHLITDADRLIPRDHPEASRLLEETFRHEGIEVTTGDAVIESERLGEMVTVETASGKGVSGTHLLVAVGTRPNLSDLNLEQAGVATTDDGRLELDESLRTSQPHIAAAGDVTGAGFTHIGNDHARTIVKNLVSPWVREHTHLTRWATFTDPEVAQIGELADSTGHGLRAMTTRLPLRRLDRAVVSAQRTGFVEVHHTYLGRIAGVTIVAPNAAELANQWVPSIGGHMTGILDMRSIYPTMGSSMPIVASEWVKSGLAGSTLGSTGRMLIRSWVWLLFRAKNLLRRVFGQRRWG